ncbi:crotonyl-CoA carboxylase/reductase [Acrocarpospora pleiomorpha]|uniref:Crotonyl-CoA carboxylase/reductase n=1 Tax=Acrocarpospora pleiomorpha TaxID=90975 RepID=A0A5M3XVT1_9ACTN|nr:crotonyl-CoA carboxylase/reductase [Acrocarpospora pleiomorpha]GES24169.1 crotonyl-CoA carboxylase/reductase [Acrocarpospora pleiomorpha]
MTSAFPIGSIPPLGEVPRRMLAQVVRQDRMGEPIDAFQIEEIDTPSLKADEVLVAVMAAGINYNNVWAARGIPIDIVAARQKTGATEEFHVGGSDAAGIVYAVGAEVSNVQIGDEVVIHHGWWDRDDPWVKAGKDPMTAPSAKVWGYDGPNYGAFGQFTVAQAHQLMPKADHLTWEEAAAPSLVGTTAYRMLFGWEGNTVQAGDVVLIWGGSGGLGTQAIQLAKLAGAIPVAVVSNAEKGKYCVSLGAAGYIDRTEFDHWGVPPHWTDGPGQKTWMAGARAFGNKIWEIVGERKSPAIVFEHPGEDTIPTSIFVCDGGGMVVVCAGTTGYSAVVDLRYHWVRQKRLQGSHGTNDAQANAYNDLVRAGKIDPCMTRVLPFEEIGRAHQEMDAGQLGLGNTSILIGASTPGLGRK